MNRQVKTICIRVAIVISLLLILAGINKVHLSPFKTKVEFDWINAISWADNAGVAVDKQGKRLLIANRNLELTHIVDMTVKGSPLDRVVDAQIIGDKIYVLGYCIYNKGVYLSSEKVLVYDLNGKYIGEKYKVEYKADDYVANCRFNSIIFEGNKIFLVSIGGNSISTIKIDSTETADSGSAKNSENTADSDGANSKTANGTDIKIWSLGNDEVIYSTMYFNQTKTIVVYTRSGNLYSIDAGSSVGSSAVAGGIATPITTEALSLFIRESLDYRLSKDVADKLAEEFYAPSITVDKDNEPQYLAMVGEDNSSAYIILKNLGKFNKIKGFDYSTGFALWNLAFWAALVFIAIMLVFACVKFFRSKQGFEYKGAAIIIGVILLVSTFYTYQSTKDLRAQFEQSIISEAKQYSVILSDELIEINSEIVQAFKTNGIEEYCENINNQQTITEFQNLIKKLCQTNGKEHPVYAYIFLINDEGKLVNLVDNESNLISGREYRYSDELIDELNRSGEVVHTAEVSTETAVYSVKYFDDSSGNHIGAVLVGCTNDNIVNEQIEKGINLFVALTTLLIFVYVLIKSLRTFSLDFARRKARGDSEIVAKSIDLAGVYVFGQKIVTGVDTVILVFVAQALCEDMSAGLKTAMIAVPLMMQNAGGWLGSVIYPTLTKKFGERKVTATGSILAIATLGTMVAAIRIKSMLIFSAAKLVFGIGAFGLIYMAGQILPINSKNEESKRQAINSTQDARMAAGIISILIGGYVSQYLSFEAVYIMTAVIMLGILLLSLIIFNKETMLVLRSKRENERLTANSDVAKISENQRLASSSEKQQSHDWRLYFTGPMISFVLLFVVAKTITGGYGSYLFPLYSASCGLSVVLLSNLTVFSKSICYGFGEEIDSKCKNMKPEQVLTRTMFLISGSLVCFIINPNIYWAIAVLFLIDVMYRANFSSMTMYVYNLAGELGYNQKEAVSNYYTVDNAISIFQAPILTAFLTLGYSYACMAVGAVTGIMVAIFNRIDKRRKADNEKV